MVSASRLSSFKYYIELLFKFFMVQPPKITFLTNRDHYADCYNSSIICNSNEKFDLIYF
jgi:hypothetical protein